MINNEKQWAFDNLFRKYYVGELCKEDGQPITYSQEDEEKDWEILRKTIDENEYLKLKCGFLQPKYENLLKKKKIQNYTDIGELIINLETYKKALTLACTDIVKTGKVIIGDEIEFLVNKYLKEAKQLTDNNKEKY